MSLTDPDIEAFFAELSDVRRLRQSEQHIAPSAADKLARKQQQALNERERAARAHPLPVDNILPVAPDDFLVYQQPGIQDAVFKNLRMGKYPIEHKISLRGLTIDDSAARVYTEIHRCHEKGVRTLLIEHGKGANSKPFPAFKKSCVKRWLDEMDKVIAYHSAQPQHGGTAATYVMLKKHPLQKQINRENNRRR